jgi:selenocysteine-specific elongation factor
MPQTIEHLDILGVLGVRLGAVALTKIDRVEEARIGEVEAAVRALLAAGPLADSPVFQVSATSSIGIEALLAHLEAEARGHPGRAASGRFRLAVDRCFTLAGAGTVVTGTVFAGAVRVGDELVVSPSASKVRVRSIHAQNRPAQEGKVGERCALNLAGVAKDEVRRGEWVVSPQLHAPGTRFDVRLRLLPGAPKKLRHWSPVHMHIGAADLQARVALLDCEELAPGGSALAQIVLDRPHASCRGDIFVLRDHSAAHTLGGGTVLDPDGPPRRRRSPARLAVLAALELPDAASALGALLDQAEHGLDLRRIARSFNCGIDSFGVPIHTAGDFGFAPAHWAALKKRVMDGLAAYHAGNADEQGPDASRVRRMWLPKLDAAACAILLDDMVADKRIARSGPWLHLPEHRVKFTDAEQRLAERLLPLVEAGGFDPLWVRDLARKLAIGEAQVRMLMNRLAKRGDIFQVVKDLFYSRKAIADLAALAAELERTDGEVRAAVFRDRTGLGRKRAIQVLEYFDRVGFTRRVREAHRLRSDSMFLRKEFASGGAAGLQTR